MSYPTTLNVAYPERLSRGLALLKVFLGWLYVGIPHGIILYLLGVVAELITIAAFFVILFTGQYPKGLFDFVVGFIRWSTNVSVYSLLLRDEYPPFSLETQANSPATVDIEYSEKLSRGHLLLKVFFGWLYVGIPHGIILNLYAILVTVVSIIAWFVILFTGQYPRGMFDLVTGYIRWTLNVWAYTYLMRDEYPPFSGSE